MCFVFISLFGIQSNVTNKYKLVTHGELLFGVFNGLESILQSRLQSFQRKTRDDVVVDQTTNQVWNIGRFKVDDSSETFDVDPEALQPLVWNSTIEHDKTLQFLLHIFSYSDNLGVHLG